MILGVSNMCTTIFTFIKIQLNWSGSDDWEGGKFIHTRGAEDGLCLWLHVAFVEWICQATHLQAFNTTKS